MYMKFKSPPKGSGPGSLALRLSKARNWSLALLVALWLGVGLALNQRTLHAEAIPEQNETGGKSAQASDLERALKQAVAARPDSFDANHQMGEFYVNTGKLLAGIPYLEKAQSLNLSHYVNGYDLALAYLETNNLSKAREQLRRMIQGQDTAELHNLLGETEEKAGDSVEAANEFQLAAHMDPTEQFIFDWGNELLLHEGFEPAVKIFTSGVKRYPQSAMLHIGLGVAAYSLGFYDDAAKALCRATDLAPSDPRPYLFLGRMFDISLIQADEVTERLKRFAEIQPGNALANYYYAMSMWKGQRGQNAQANTDKIAFLLKRAATLDPRFPDPHLQLGILYAGQQRYADAIREYQQAAKLKPDLSDAHYRLARAYSRTGESILAKKELELYKKLHQNDLAEEDKRRREGTRFIFDLQGNPPSQ
jgi:tetratricopeptide (TPR) repeat protein